MMLGLYDVWRTRAKCRCPWCAVDSDRLADFNILHWPLHNEDEHRRRATTAAGRKRPRAYASKNWGITLAQRVKKSRLNRADLLHILTNYEKFFAAMDRYTTPISVDTAHVRQHHHSYAANTALAEKTAKARRVWELYRPLASLTLRPFCATKCMRPRGNGRIAQEILRAGLRRVFQRNQRWLTLSF
jgi:hypothetical protein